MNSISLIFPHQLFKEHPPLLENMTLYLVEEWLFFRQYNFHQQKIILHRSGMKFYEAYLKEQNYTVQYIDTNQERSDITKLIAYLSQQKITMFISH